MNSKYGLCTVVFDGYNSRSTKDHEHRRRAAQVFPCSDVSVTNGTNLSYTRDFFLIMVTRCISSDYYLIIIPSF